MMANHTERSEKTFEFGCFFDDPVHEVLGLRDTAFQSLYHFTVGGPIVGHRLETLPPYGHLEKR
jgi:hypothetical protein